MNKQEVLRAVAEVEAKQSQLNALLVELGNVYDIDAMDLDAASVMFDAAFAQVLTAIDNAQQEE